MAANFLTITDQDKPLTATGVKNRMIARLLQEGSSTEPITSHFQGLNRVAQSLLGGYQLREADKEEKSNQALQTQTLAALLSGSPPPQQAAPSMPPMRGTPPVGFAPPAPSMAPAGAPPQNVSNPVPSDDPTMGLPPSVIQRANPDVYPQGVAPAVAGITSGPRPATGMHQPTPTPSPPAPPGPMAGMPPQAPGMPGTTTSSAAPPDMQAKIAAMLHPSQPEAVQKMGRQLAAQILSQRMKPDQLKSVVIGEQAFVFNERTGQYAPGPSAVKLTDEEKNLGAENRSRVQRGEQPLTMLQWEQVKKAATSQGQQQGEAAFSLDATLGKTQQALDTIRQIREHPGKQYGLGVMGVIPGIPGTAQRGFVSLVDQAKGQSFLQAFEALKGGGAITEREGAAATAAIARLDRAQSPADFDRALSDLEGIITRGMDVARKRSGQGGPASGAPQGGGQVRRYNPATGRIE